MNTQRIINMYKLYRKNVPWYADEKLHYFNTQLQELRELFPQVDENEQPKLIKKADEYKKFIQALT